MNDPNECPDQIITKLIEMGFESSIVLEAIKQVGPSLNHAAEYLLNESFINSGDALSSAKCSTSNGKALGKRGISSHPLGQMRQSSIVEHFQSTCRPKRSRTRVPNALISRFEVIDDLMEGDNELLSGVDLECKTMSGSSPLELDIGVDLEQKVSSVLQKHFGYSSLKSFQKEALAAWAAHKDCLVLAATGSGKSLCFQITALITQKVVVVISPLISLMHDQCLKLAKNGVSACFLGSGQPDSRVEQKALRGMYDIMYVCPETVLRLIKPLQRLAETRGIALFAIDEVHCVSKWGHDFRPDYRKMSVLRENFSMCNLKFLKHDIPLMALTATATIRVREDIIESLHMSKEMKIVCTSFFRSNLRFSVNHSKTSLSSYEKDFSELIDMYTGNRKDGQNNKLAISQTLEDMSDESTSSRNSNSGRSDSARMSPRDLNYNDDGYFVRNNDEVYSEDDGSTASKGKHMSVEYLEDEADVFQDEEDWDVACGEFFGQYPGKDWDVCGPSEILDLLMKPEERLRLQQGPLERGASIIYVPTRKETLNIAKYLCSFGVKAAAYNAKLPKSHLRRVHKEFHENALEVVVATIAFGMGIDKPNVRRIMHYGWPQSLEAYYQEAGRAGRDGKLADCTLYANLSRTPSLLPSKRSDEQTKQAYKMLSDCFRYGMSTSCCRAKTLVQYFGERFSYEKCLLCDVCVNGHPGMKNVKEEACIFMQVISSYYGQSRFAGGSHNEGSFCDVKRRLVERPNIRMVVSKIREQSQKFMATDLLWWQGLARILEDKGYIKEGDKKISVQIKFPEPTELGLEFLQSEPEKCFMVYPEADMTLSTSICRHYSSFSEWGKGWADPEIRRQRLERRRESKRPRKRRKSRRPNAEFKTVRGRLAAKLSKH